MNAERLILIVNAISEDIKNTEIINKLKNVISSLNNYIASPNSQHQEQITKSREELTNAINASNFSNFPKTWHKTLDELKILPLLGIQLQTKVNEIFARNQITFDTAKSELQSIYENLTKYEKSFAQIMEAFEFLDIVGEIPTAGEAELSVLMPSSAFDEELEKFGKEVEFFDGTIKLFSEIYTGSRETPHIKQLSSSDPTILILIGVPTLAGLLWVTKEILDIIIKTEKLRKAKNEAEKAEADARISVIFKEQIEKEINEGISGLTDSIIQNYTLGDNRRKKELKIELEIVLKGIASRLDNGYELDGDVGEIELKETEEGEEENNTNKKLFEQIRTIKEIVNEIRYLDRPQEPVLNLPTPIEKVEGREDQELQDE